jgi:hypothetical protein
MVRTLTFHEALQSLKLPGLERNLFSSPDWIDVLYKTYRLKLFVKYIERDGRIASYIIYSVVKNFLEWKICICSYCDYCDGYVESVEDWRLFFQSLREEYPLYRIAVRNLRDELVRQLPEMELLSTERFHLLDVRGDLPAVRKRMNDSFKAAINQSERSGVVVKRCEKEELKKFFHLHLNVRRRKYRIFPQPYRFFEIIWQQYMDNGKGVLLGAYDQKGRFIGGNVYLVCGNTLYYKFNTSLQDALMLRPNNLLFWEGIKYAKERGLEYLDLGSSGAHQKGLILFKEHAGAQSHDIRHYGYTPPGYKFSTKRILKIFTTVFTWPWMPDFMVKWGSHIIYPYLA